MRRWYGLGLQPLVRRGFIRKPPVTGQHNGFFLCRKTACSNATSALFLSENRLYIADITDSVFRKRRATFHDHGCRKIVCHFTTSAAFCAQKHLLTAREGILCRKRPLTLQHNGGLYYNLMTKSLIFLSQNQLISSPTHGGVHHHYPHISRLFSFLPKDAAAISGFYCC